ncbi:MAG: hypothetical protein ACOCZE_00730 [Planctomycetota bacterium]
MDEHARTTRFSDVAFNEAAARHVRVNLLIKPVYPGDPRQLSSRFLGWAGSQKLVLEAATKQNGQKVFLPTGWNLGLGFAVGNLFMQAQSAVCGQTLHLVRPGRRIDAILIAKPDKVVSIARRKEIRYEVETPHLTTASIWQERELMESEQLTCRDGRVINWSASGLGIRLAAPLPFSPDTPVILRIEGLQDRTCRFYRGLFRHCSQLEPQFWVAGFGDVEEIIPGQCYPLIERLSAC